MSKEKQIEEMAEYISGNAITHDTQFKEDCRSIARDLYSAGYRKQSEGEWIKKDGFLVCSECDATKPIAFSTVLKITYYKCDYCNRCGAKMRKEDEGK